MGNYIHPHQTYTLNDNTRLSTESAINTEPFLFQPFFSSDGEDSKIIDMYEINTILEEYGDPSISLYGQSYYHVLNWLSAGGAVKGIRLTAKNATYANKLLMLHVKVSEIQKTNASGDPLYIEATTGDETTLSSGNTPIMIKQANVKLSYESFTNISSANTDLQSLMRTKMTEDADGTKHFPLFLTVCTGKGAYGKKYRTRIVPAPVKDRNSKYRHFTFELYKNDGGLTRIDPSPITISSYPEAKNGAKQSIYFGDIINMNALPVKVYGLDDAITAASATLLPIVQQQDADAELSGIDILTFYNTDRNKYDNIIVDPESVDLSILQGHGLGSGSDGDFDITNPNRWDAMYDRLIDLFRGKIDSSLLDNKEQKFVIMLDANYPLEVKKEMISLRDARDSEVLKLDAGFLYTVDNTKAYLTEELLLDGESDKAFGTFVGCHNFDTYDKYTGKNIQVTENYLWSILLPQHILNKGSHIPFAGVDIPLDSYIVKGSLKPVVYSEADKETLAQLGCNYIERENGKYIFGTNFTSQTYESELRYSNNVLVYYEIKEAITSLSAIFRFKFTDSDNDLNTLNKLANAKVEPFRESKVTAIEIEVIKNTADETGKSVKTVAHVGFKNFDLNNDIIVNIDRY